MPKRFGLHVTNILRTCLNTNEDNVKVGECLFLVIEGNNEVQPHRAMLYNTEIIFKDEDILLGGTPHNYPFFVKGYAHEQQFKRILIDQGSTLNILSLRAMKELGISTDELSQSCLMIQVFNLAKAS